MKSILFRISVVLIAILYNSENGVFGFLTSSSRAATSPPPTSDVPKTVLYRGPDGRNPTSFEGTDLTVAEYPHPVLRRLGDTVEDFDDSLRKLAGDMITIMYAADGVGLAAPQVNLSKRLFVYNPTGDPNRKDMERIVVNPHIVDYSTQVEIDEEACLSSRSGQCAGMVCRSRDIMVEYQNERGAKFRKKLTDFEARVFQHEYDHVEGILHFDRFCPEDRTKIQPKLDVLVGDHDTQASGSAELVPNQDRFAKLQPAPLPRRGWMPPLAEAAAIGMKAKAAASKKKNKKKQKAKRGGGGGGGFGGGGFGKS